MVEGEAEKTSEGGLSSVPLAAVAVAELRQGYRASEVCRQRWASRSSLARLSLDFLCCLMVTFWLVTWRSKFPFTDMCGLQSCLYMRYMRYLWDGVLETLGLRLFAGHSAVSGNVITWPRAQWWEQRLFKTWRYMVFLRHRFPSFLTDLELPVLIYK